jgi:hypothetical protein
MDNKKFVPIEKIISDHLLYKDFEETLKELCDKPIDHEYFVKLIEKEKENEKSNDNIKDDTTTELHN